MACGFSVNHGSERSFPNPSVGFSQADKILPKKWTLSVLVDRRHSLSPRWNRMVDANGGQPSLHQAFCPVHVQPSNPNRFQSP